MSDLEEYRKIYDKAHKCYRNKTEIECNTESNQCSWYPGYYDKFCYPVSLNKNAELTTGTGIMGTGNSNQLNMYKQLVAQDEEQEKIISDKINQTLESMGKRIEKHRLANNFLHYLTTYEKINLLDNKTMQGTVLLLLISSVNNILKENGLSELTIDTMAPKLIVIIKHIREIYERWKTLILMEHQEVLEKTYTLSNSKSLSQIDGYVTDNHIDVIFSRATIGPLTFNELRKEIGEYLYNILYQRTLGQESYIKQILIGTIGCGLRACTSVDLKQITISKLLPLFGLETDEEFLQYIYDLIKPRYSDGSELYENQYNQFIKDLNNKIKNINPGNMRGGNSYKDQYLDNKSMYMRLMN